MKEIKTIKGLLAQLDKMGIAYERFDKEEDFQYTIKDRRFMGYKDGWKKLTVPYIKIKNVVYKLKYYYRPTKCLGNKNFSKLIEIVK